MRLYGEFRPQGGLFALEGEVENTMAFVDLGRANSNSYTAEASRAADAAAPLSEARFGPGTSLEMQTFAFASSELPKVARSGRVMKAGVDFPDTQAASFPTAIAA